MRSGTQSPFSWVGRSAEYYSATGYKVNPVSNEKPVGRAFLTVTERPFRLPPSCPQPLCPSHGSFRRLRVFRRQTPHVRA